ncbi:MAG: PHP domain-containing protein, partial [Clostridia bacterium]|nr:PHP domain-containing protein [Clostridia bacterium]
MYSFKELFSDYLDAQILDVFDGVEIQLCKLNNETRTLELKLSGGSTYIPCAKITLLREAIKHALQLEDVTVNVSFLSSAFCVDAVEDIVAEIRAKNIIFNGFFNEAQYNLDGDELKIILKYGGYDLICDGGFEKNFKLIAKNRFDRDIKISFDGVLHDAPIILPEVEPVAVQKSAPSAKPVKKEEPKQEKKYNYKPKDGLPVYLESASVFFGRKIDTNVKKLKDVMLPQNDSESVYVCAWGEVFGCESRIVDTKRGGKMVKVKFYFSDTTNSFSASLTKFFDPKYTKNMDEAANEFLNSVSALKNGACVIVNGDYSYDSWTRDFVLDVRALATVKKYEETDDYDGDKRVELHCHTNMSAKDAVASAGDIINRAYKWGHKAVAITDHGVVQAYPAIAEAVGKIRKGGGEFKAIYGVENYFIDDTRYDI